VLEAAEGPQAVRTVERLKGDLDLMLVDSCLPGMNGFELIGVFTRRETKIKIIAASSVFKDFYLKIAETLGANSSMC
jgi:CheY-like chemotaxis protein